MWTACARDEHITTFINMLFSALELSTVEYILHAIGEVVKS